MPSAWPSTGIRVLSWMKRTSSLEPRGMIRSTRPSSLSRARLSWREVSRARASADTGERARPACRAERIAAQLRLASLPPLSRAPLPERIAREAICITASGLASKITPSTPRGTLSRSSTSPSASSVWSWRRPIGSARAATWRTPSMAAASLRSSSFRRATRAGARPALAAASRSAWLAATIVAASASRASAMASTAVCRSPSASCPRAMAARRTAAARCSSSGEGSGTLTAWAGCREAPSSATAQPV